MRTTPAVSTATIARTTALESLPELLALLPDDRPLAWVRGGDGLVGWGEVARFVGSGTDRFADAERQWRAWAGQLDTDDECPLPGTGPVAFGAFTFSPRSAGSVLIVPQVVVGRRGEQAWVTTIGDVAAPLGPVAAPTDPGEIRYSDGAQPSTRWTTTVAEAVRHIRAGELGKVVLARDVLAVAGDPIDTRLLLHRLARRYRDECWTFSCDGIIGATPELLVHRFGEEVRSRVLAGTIRRGRDDVEDADLARWLLASPKNRAEHEYAARSVGEALVAHCTDIDLPGEPELLPLANLTHLASPIHARTTDGATSLTLAGALHPTAAVCGTPTEAAMQLIDDLEEMDRQRYAGPVGWTDLRGDGEWGIALRCAEIDGQEVRMFAGCGIVADSEPDAELAESQVKLAPMRYALEGS